jgi:acyl-coenzyme A synthetase/AMP-(fatty) acid ligase
MSVRPRTGYLMETERPAIAGAAATAVELLARHPDFGRRDLSSVRVLAPGGMPVPADLSAAPSPAWPRASTSPTAKPKPSG